jgi:hypothetical protein
MEHSRGVGSDSGLTLLPYTADVAELLRRNAEFAAGAFLDGPG